MSSRLKGHVAVVTGASRGIGRSIALALACEGCSVTVAARSEELLADVASEIVTAGGKALAFCADITSEEDIAGLRDASTEAFGPATILINSAGAYQVGRFTDIAVMDFERLMQTNYISIVRTIKAFLPDMLAAQSGSIIAIASTAGKSGSALQSPYNGSKHAVVGLCRSLGLEFATTGVRFNAICPGFVDTDMVDNAIPCFAKATGIDPDQIVETLLQRIPMRRMLTPDEVAHLAVYLASDEARGMTGQAMTISGGMLTS